MRIQLKEVKNIHSVAFSLFDYVHWEQPSQGPAAILTEEKGMYSKDMEGNTYVDGTSSFWHVNVGHGREEISQVAKEQMAALAFIPRFAAFSNESAIGLATWKNSMKNVRAIAYKFLSLL